MLGRLRLSLLVGDTSMAFDLKKIKVLSFDCDGTLMDTIPDYLYSMNEALGHFSLPPITKEEAYSFLGNGTDHFLHSSLKGKKEGQFEEIKEYYLNVYKNHFFVDTKIYPGIKEFLKEAQRKGYKLSVLSNKPDFILKPLISTAFPEIRFDFVGGQQGQARKPDPLLLNMLKERLRVRGEEICYFGDTEVDYEFALNASVKNVFIVSYGFRTEEYLKRVTKPISFFKTVEEMRTFFNL